MLEEFRGNISTSLIGVHVRRTDYKDLLGKTNPYIIWEYMLRENMLFNWIYWVIKYP